MSDKIKRRVKMSFVIVFSVGCSLALMAMPWAFAETAKEVTMKTTIDETTTVSIGFLVAAIGSAFTVAGAFWKFTKTLEKTNQLLGVVGHLKCVHTFTDYDGKTKFEALPCPAEKRQLTHEEEVAALHHQSIEHDRGIIMHKEAM